MSDPHDTAMYERDTAIQAIIDGDSQAAVDAIDRLLRLARHKTDTPELAELREVAQSASLFCQAVSDAGLVHVTGFIRNVGDEYDAMLGSLGRLERGRKARQ